MIQALAARDR